MRTTWCPDPTPGLDEVIETFHQNYRALDDRVQKLTDEAWGQSTKLYIGDKLIGPQSLISAVSSTSAVG